MPTITATKAGNWSDTSVWDLTRVPQDGDDVALAGYIIVWDIAQTRIPATGTLASISSTGTAGQVTLALFNDAFHDGAELNATNITAGTKPASAGIISFSTSNATTHVLTINTGKTPNGIFGGSNSGANAIYCAIEGAHLVINGDIGGGSYANAHTVNIMSGVVCTVTGDLYGGTSYAFICGNSAAAGSLTINGNITAAASSGLHNSTTGAVTITGSIKGSDTAKGICGVNNNSTGTITFGMGSQLIQGIYAAAYNGYAPIWTSSLTNRSTFYTGDSPGQAANTDFPQQLAADQIKKDVVSGTVTGTLSAGATINLQLLTDAGWNVVQEIA
jgi:hypothetical protein